MASLINSIRSIGSDPWWFVKLSMFSAALFFLIDENLNYPGGDPNLVPVFITVVAIMIGCAGVAMNRNINNKTPLFPSLFSIPEVIIKSILLSLIVLPGALIYYLAITFVQANFSFEDDFIYFVIYTCLTIFISPFIFVPAVLYSVNGKFTEALKINYLFEAAGNFAVQFASYLLQYCLIIGSFTILIYFLLYEMLGDHFSLLILASTVIVISFFSVFLFSSDLYQDVIPEIKDKRLEKQKKKLRR